MNLEHRERASLRMVPGCSRLQAADVGNQTQRSDRQASKFFRHRQIEVNPRALLLVPPLPTQLGSNGKDPSRTRGTRDTLQNQVGGGKAALCPGLLDDPRLPFAIDSVFLAAVLSTAILIWFSNQ